MLENTLLDFLNGDYDVLVATTIIETGIDISNVNTLFIENADHMGLSTLYQLRGRVGRSNRIAYAYLMYRPDKVLTEVSEKRLDAIKGFINVKVKLKFAVKEMQSSIFRLMLTSLLTIFLTSAKKLKFINVFEKLRIRKTIKTFKMSLLTALENIQTKLPISLRLVWLRPI